MNQAACTRVGDNLSDELRELWPELADDLFPHSRRAVPDDQRDALRAEYSRVNGRFDRSQVITDRVGIDAGGRYGAATATQNGSSVYRPVDAVSLNPQPLPPGPPDPDLAQPAQAAVYDRADMGAEAGIIIVGGKTLYRRATKARRHVVDDKALERAAETPSPP